MLDIISTSTSVKSQARDGLCCHNPSEPKVRLGQEAMARQRRRWEDWMLIAEALDFGRTEIMRALYTNAPTGRRYEKAMAEWLIANGFKEIDKGARCRLLECLKHRDEIERWRAPLTDSERFRFNHPDTVLRKWKAATVIPSPDAKPKPSPFAQLKTAHAELIEEHHRLQHKIEAADGDLWKATDTPADIADVMVAALSPAKAERTAREILKRVKERKVAAQGGGRAMTQKFPIDHINVRRKDGGRETWEQFRLGNDAPSLPPASVPASVPDIAAQTRDTPKGMATWAGTGPSGRACGQCEHFNETAWQSGWCAEFARLMKGGRHWRADAKPEKIAPRFSALTSACRNFTQKEQTK